MNEFEQVTYFMEDANDDEVLPSEEDVDDDDEDDDEVEDVDEEGDDE